MSAVLSFAFGPSSQRMSSAARPFLAAHVWSATTATASSRRTTWLHALDRLRLAVVDATPVCRRTPAKPRPWRSSCRAPDVDAELRRAVDLVGARPGAWRGVPISLKSLRVLELRPCRGTGSFAASSTRRRSSGGGRVGYGSPSPFSARQELASTFHACAAAATSMRARGRAGMAQRLVVAAHRGRAAGHLDAEQGLRRASSSGGACSSVDLARDPTSSSSAISIGMRGVRALPHFHLWHHERDLPVTSDANEGVGRKGIGGRRRWRHVGARQSRR